MNLEKVITDMGLQFRNLTHHSDGRWSCKLMHSFKGADEFWADTPIEAVLTAREYLDQFEE